MAVALTALLLLLVGDGAAEDAPAPESPPADEAPDPAVALEEATGTVRELWSGLYALLPKLGFAILLVTAAWLLSLLLGLLFRRLSPDWHRAVALAALLRIALLLGAIAGALAIVAGDPRALLGSVGLIGLALSWALQTPIESFTGWILNSFRGYYRVGDRIEVGDVFGDVARIDILTTTVWEAGGPGKAVAGAQPTGALITFPNWELLRSNVINYNRDFPYIWDEITIGIANDSDLGYAVRLVRDVARELLGPTMRDPAAAYQNLLRQSRLGHQIEELPSVFLAPAESWTDCTVRYLVPVRERRAWASRLYLALNAALASSEHRSSVAGGYPRQEVRLYRMDSPAAGNR